ncbi:frizzled-like [Condylostylus longicornis]|uniref:frizzled-like n=1 Tax=Condylostylus longicornis TaxID=2530218 RepID=UPI00244DCF87|nr:frizzled-like [Condylostylus longicornis]
MDHFNKLIKISIILSILINLCICGQRSSSSISSTGINNGGGIGNNNGVGISGGTSHFVQQNGEIISEHSQLSGSEDLFPHHGRCEPITISICKDIPYNMTIMPNIIGHTRQEEAGLEVHQFAPLVKIACSADIQLFLCSLYVPVCTILETPIPPCRELCESARQCETLMKQYNFNWPENLECSKFPLLESKEMCLHRNNTTTTPSPIRTNTPKVIHTRKGFIDGQPHRNIGFVCPVQLKTPSGMGYSLKVGGKVRILPSKI